MGVCTVQGNEKCKEGAGGKISSVLVFLAFGEFRLRSFITAYDVAKKKKMKYLCPRVVNISTLLTGAM